MWPNPQQTMGLVWRTVEAVNEKNYFLCISYYWIIFFSGISFVLTWKMAKPLFGDLPLIEIFEISMSSPRVLNQWSCMMQLNDSTSILGQVKMIFGMLGLVFITYHQFNQ